MTNKGFEITGVLCEDPGLSSTKRYLMPLNCTDSGALPLAMSSTKSLVYWVRCGYKEMIGEPKSMLEALHDETAIQQIVRIRTQDT
jgi:hypothetical protein